MKAKPTFDVFEAIKEFNSKWTSTIRNDVKTMEDFSFKKPLGHGAFGKVALVEEKKTKILYALKVILHDKKPDIEEERKILECTNFPFIVKLICSFEVNLDMCLVMEFLSGGELFDILRKSRRFSEDHSKFYSSQVVLAFEYLHAVGVIYRDLKPENLVLSQDGYIKLIDFGLSTTNTDTLWAKCGTPQYMAPEMVLYKGYRKSIDWWALGVLIYELSSGHEPFISSDKPITVLKQTFQVKYPFHFSEALRSIIGHLLEKDTSKRFGCLVNGAGDIENHYWFMDIDWNAMYNKKISPPFIPSDENALTFITQCRKLTRSPSTLNNDAFNITGI